jgi:hypothetical protein
MWAEAFGSGKPRTPLEFVASALRGAGAEVNQTRAVKAALQDMGMPLYACNPPTGYSNRGDEWLDPSSQLYRMNFGLDLAAGAVAGVSVDMAGLVRGGGGNPDDPRSAADAIDRVAFGGTLSSTTLAAAASVDRSGSVAVPARVAGLLFASPDMQAR